MPATAGSPKCFAEVQGKRILDWGLEALAAADIRDICFIGGYQIDKVRADYPHMTFRLNSDWPHNNILVSLMQGEDLMNGHRWTWYGKNQWMRIEPWHQPFGIWRITTT